MAITEFVSRQTRLIPCLADNMPCAKHRGRLHETDKSVDVCILLSSRNVPNTILKVAQNSFLIF